jgi:hypothetical protein
MTIKQPLLSFSILRNCFHEAPDGDGNSHQARLMHTQRLE